MKPEMRSAGRSALSAIRRSQRRSMPDAATTSKCRRSHASRATKNIWGEMHKQYSSTRRPSITRSPSLREPANTRPSRVKTATQGRISRTNKFSNSSTKPVGKHFSAWVGLARRATQTGTTILSDRNARTVTRQKAGLPRRHLIMQEPNSNSLANMPQLCAANATAILN